MNYKLLVKGVTNLLNKDKYPEPLFINGHRILNIKITDPSNINDSQPKGKNAYIDKRGFNTEIAKRVSFIWYHNFRAHGVVVFFELV